MLVLSRHIGESIIIGKDENKTVLTVLGNQGANIKLGFIASANIPIDREEIHQKKHTKVDKEKT